MNVSTHTAVSNVNSDPGISTGDVSMVGVRSDPRSPMSVGQLGSSTMSMRAKAVRKRKINAQHNSNFRAGYVPVDEDALHRTGIRGRKRYFFYCILVLLMIIAILNTIVTAFLLYILGISHNGMVSIELTSLGGRDFLRVLAEARIITMSFNDAPLGARYNSSLFLESKESPLEIKFTFIERNSFIKLEDDNSTLTTDQFGISINGSDNLDMVDYSSLAYNTNNNQLAYNMVANKLKIDSKFIKRRSFTHLDDDNITLATDQLGIDINGINDREMATLSTLVHKTIRNPSEDETTTYKMAKESTFTKSSSFKLDGENITLTTDQFGININSSVNWVVANLSSLTANQIIKNLYVKNMTATKICGDNSSKDGDLNIESHKTISITAAAGFNITANKVAEISVKSNVFITAQKSITFDAKGATYLSGLPVAIISNHTNITDQQIYKLCICRSGQIFRVPVTQSGSSCDIGPELLTVCGTT